MRKKSPEHVVLDPGRSGAFLCLNCGTSYDPKLPQPINMLVAMMDVFTKEHRSCKPRPNPARERLDRLHDIRPMTPDEWARGDDVGLSSATIWHVMTGRPSPLDGEAGNCPLDPDDFGRCERLLRRVAGWRERLPEVAARFPQWAPLVREWPELVKLYDEEYPTGDAPKLYARMKELEEEVRGG